MGSSAERRRVRRLIAFVVPEMKSIALVLGFFGLVRSSWVCTCE